MRAMTSILVPLFFWAATYGAGGSPGTGAPSPASAAQPSDPALEAEAAVARNLKTEAGRKYADSAAAMAAGKLGAAWKTCRDSLSAGGAGPDTSGLDVYVLLNRRGSAKGLLVRPQGKMEPCMTAHLGASLVFSTPPDGNYWLKLRAGRGPVQAPGGKPGKP
jgi:hypothetical protein